MHGDDLAIVLFFLTLTVGLGIETMKAETTARRVGFGTLAVVFLLIGIFWLQIKQVSPSVTEFVTSIGTNPSAWFVVFILILIVFVVHRPKIHPAENRPASSTQETPEPSEDKTIIDVDPLYLMSLYENRTGLQADMLALAYIGRWIKVSGIVSDVNAIPLTSGHLLNLKPDPSKMQYVMLFFDEVWNERLTRLRNGQEINCVGKVKSISKFYLQINKAEIVDE